MCIIGLPVHVHVKDGSVYSGIFHAASIDRDYGIVLKKARMTKKGKGKANVGKDDLIDTLVILSGDLVQVVAKGVVLPPDGVGENITGNDDAVVHKTFCSEVTTCEAEKTTGSLMDKKHTNQSSEAWTLSVKVGLLSKLRKDLLIVFHLQLLGMNIKKQNHISIRWEIP